MITYIATALVDLVVGLIALSRRKNPAALALALFALSLGLWQTELFLLSTINDVEQLAPWFHLTRTGMFFAPMFLALLTWRICGSSSERFRQYILIPGFAGAAIVSLLNNTILPSELGGGGFRLFAKAGYCTLSFSSHYNCRCPRFYCLWPFSGAAMHRSEKNGVSSGC